MSLHLCWPTRGLMDHGDGHDVDSGNVPCLQESGQDAASSCSTEDSSSEAFERKLARFVGDAMVRHSAATCACTLSIRVRSDDLQRLACGRFCTCTVGYPPLHDGEVAVPKCQVCFGVPVGAASASGAVDGIVRTFGVAVDGSPPDTPTDIVKDS
eukprot:4860226-Amphidinium_carterae.1